MTSQEFHESFRFDTSNDKQQQQYEASMSKAIYASGLPLSTFDRKEWQEFFKLLRPAFKVPKRKALSTQLLDEQFHEARDRVNCAIEEAKSVSLIIDGSEDVNSMPIINVIACTPTPYFIDSIATHEKSKTGEMLCLEITPIIENIGIEKITAVVVDQGKNMGRMFVELEKKYPKIVLVNCAAHSLNNLVKDIVDKRNFPSFDQLLKQSHTVIREITSSGMKKSCYLNVKSQSQDQQASTSLRTYSLTR